MMQSIKRSLIVSVLCASFAGVARAVDPFDNWANPEGLYFVDYPLHYNAQSFTDLNGDVSALNTDTDFHVTQNLFRLVYYKSAPKTSLWNIVVPVGRVDFLDEHHAGIGDILLSAGYFFIDDKQSNTYLGVGIKVDMPTGAYDKERFAANMGSNVWRYRPLLAGAKLAGPFNLEATVHYDMRSANKDFRTVAMTPMGPAIVDMKYKEGDRLNLETYAGMFLSRKHLVGLHVNQTWGKDAEINGVETPGTAVKFGEVGGSFLWMATEKFNVLFKATTDFAPKNTFRGTLFMMRLAYKVK